MYWTHSLFFKLAVVYLLFIYFILIRLPFRIFFGASYFVVLPLVTLNEGKTTW